jgi:lipopolysaccharide/colanic/teichoic acid biosynthesis glycosyltransferase
LPKEYLLKRPFDIALALVGLILSCPLWIIIAIFILIDDRGPIFFLQERCGKSGKPFKLIKFRSMLHRKDKVHDIIIMENDPRVTRVGRIIRATATDELPSLLNILSGDMSFVGPRVHPYITYGIDIRQIPGYAQRSTLRPGLTGITQVYASKDISLEEKFIHDISYIEKISLWFDIKLILLSFWVTLRGKWEYTGRKV